MCCTHILILSSKGNTPCYYSMSVVVQGTYSVPRLFFMREVRFLYLDYLERHLSLALYLYSAWLGGCPQKRTLSFLSIF